jgi:phage terminase small subunit
MPKKKKRALTAQQEAFCQHYTKHWNATRACKEAKYKEKNAHVMGYQLLQNTLVQERIDQLNKHALKEIGITRERVLSEIASIAFSNVDDFAIVEDGELRVLDTAQRSADKSRVIKKITQSKSTSAEGGSFSQGFELHDKMKALELVGKHLSGPEGGPIETKDVSGLSPDAVDARIKELLAKNST